MWQRTNKVDSYNNRSAEPPSNLNHLPNREKKKKNIQKQKNVITSDPQKKMHLKKIIHLTIPILLGNFEGLFLRFVSPKKCMFFWNNPKPYIKTTWNSTWQFFTRCLFYVLEIATWKRWFLIVDMFLGGIFRLLFCFKVIPSWELTCTLSKALSKMFFLFPKLDMLVPTGVKFEFSVNFP